MTNLREKYAEVIANMVKDAEANVAEATANVEQRVKEHEAAVQKLKNLTNTANRAKSQFAEEGKHLRQLGKAINPSANEVEAISQPLHTYAKAARQVPDATYEVDVAADNVFDAKVQQNKAEDDLNKISFFAIAGTVKL